MNEKLIIHGQLPGLNEYTNANRRNRYEAAAMKRQAEAAVMLAAKRQLRGVHYKQPVILHYTWYERDRRRDHDNVAFAQKFVQDALVKCGVLEGDGWAHVEGFTHRFLTDKKHPRIEIEIEERGICGK